MHELSIADAVVTIDSGTINYSSKCELASFPYRESVSNNTFEVNRSSFLYPKCSGAPSERYLRFYFELRQSSAIKDIGGSVTVGETFDPFQHLSLIRFSPPGVEFRRWRIAKILDEVVLRAPKFSSDIQPRIEFDHGILQGSPGCGGLVGSYVLAERHLHINASLFLVGFCRPENLRENHNVLRALNRASRFERRGDDMSLIDDAGKTQVVLAPDE